MVAFVDKNGVHVDHIYFITYDNTVYWMRKLGMTLLRARAWWYRRYTPFRWFLEPWFKNWAEEFEILALKNPNVDSDNLNFKF